MKRLKDNFRKMVSKKEYEPILEDSKFKKIKIQCKTFYNNNETYFLITFGIAFFLVFIYALFASIFTTEQMQIVSIVSYTISIVCAGIATLLVFLKVFSK